MNLSKHKIVIERQRAKRIGKIIWIFTLVTGIIGWIYWNWYALLISFGLAFLGSAVYSYYIGKKIEKETGLNIYEQELVFKKHKQNHKLNEKKGEE